MKPITEQIHEEVLSELDRLISNAHEAKENYLLKRYEETAANFDEIAGARKKAEALVNEMWE